MRNVRWRYAGRAAEIWHEHNRCNESAEHYLKAESCTQAAGCYGEFGFQSNAAQCYVKSTSWKRVAEYSNAFYIEAAARLLGEHYRDRGEIKEAVQAACLLAGPYAWSESYAPGVAAPRKNSVSRYLFTTRPDLRVTRQPVEVIVSGRASG